MREQVKIDTRIEWRRFAPGQWHRVRLANSLALCARRVVIANAVPGFKRRDLRSCPPLIHRCQGCEQAWPVFRWAVARLRRAHQAAA